MSRPVCVEVPATTANLGPGFDAIGMALELRNRIRMEEVPAGLEVEVGGPCADHIPRGPENLVVRAAEHLFENVGRRPAGLRVQIDAAIPVGSGLGSSSSALVGGLVAANLLVGSPLDTRALLNLAGGMEGHPDNVAPALLGGFVVGALEGDADVRALSFPVPERLQCVVSTPEGALFTSKARQALPEQVPFEDAQFNLERASLLVSAMVSGELDLLRVAMKDRLHQPYRMEMVPALGTSIRAATEAGALGAVLSGAGPSVLALCRERDVDDVVRALEGALQSGKVSGRVYTLSPTNRGAVVVEGEKDAYRRAEIRR